MRVITAQESKIRTTERTIKTGGTVIRHVSGFTASAAKKTGNAVKNFDVQFNGGYDEENSLSFRAFWQKRAEHYMAP